MSEQNQFVDNVLSQAEQGASAHPLWTAIYENMPLNEFGPIAPLAVSELNVDGRNALMWACYLGREEWSKALAKISDLSVVDNIGRTALMWAADSGAGRDPTWLIGDYESLFAEDSNGDTATGIAARRGDAMCAFYLLIAHRRQDIWRAPPEAYAVAFNAEPYFMARRLSLEPPHIKAIQRYVDALRPDSKLSRGVSALHLAAVMGMSDKVGRLLEEGADPRALGEEGRTPLMEAVMKAPACVDQQDRVNTAKRLIEVSDPLWQDDNGKSALMHAAEACDIDMVRLLLPVSDPNAITNFQSRDAFDLTQPAISEQGKQCAAALALKRRKFARRPLEHDLRGNLFRSAAAKGDLSALVKMLDNEQARVVSGEIDALSKQPEAPLSHRVDSRGRDGLMRAAEAGHADCVALLIKTSDPYAFDRSRSTALMHAAKRGQVECVRLLLDVSSRDARDSSGNTALMTAVDRGHADTARALLASCRSDLVNNAGRTITELAAHSDSAETLALVKSVEIPGALRRIGHIVKPSSDSAVEP